MELAILGFQHLLGHDEHFITFMKYGQFLNSMVFDSEPIALADYFGRSVEFSIRILQELKHAITVRDSVTHIIVSVWIEIARLLDYSFISRLLRDESNWIIQAASPVTIGAEKEVPLEL